MASDRYVLVGLARTQCRWFLDVARWSTSGALPAEFLKVLSTEELRARLRSGRAFSAVLVDATLPGCDRDLAELAGDSGCALVVVDDRFGPGHWRQLGVDAVLPPDFGRDDLLAVLRAEARPVSRTDAAAEVHRLPVPTAAGAGAGSWRGRLIAVTGAGGTGRSTIAMAVATGLAADPRDRRLVVLADLALRAHQALLHDAGDLVPGLSELVDAYRASVLASDEVRRLCFAVPRQGYDLLLGLRRPREWAALRPARLAAALDGLQGCYRLVVADVDADVEGEDECGSVEVEERNLLARTTMPQADLVLVLGSTGVAGTATQVQIMRDLLELGVPPERLVPLVNRAPRNPRARAEIGRALVELLEAVCPGRTERLASTPLFVPERRRLDDALRDDGRLPAALVQAVAEPVRTLLDRVTAAEAVGRETDPPVEADGLARIVPGSLPKWSVLSGEHA